jgi:hypothetical protein
MVVLHLQENLRIYLKQSYSMDLEVFAIMDNQAWKLVPCQQGKNIIDCKWVYKIKRKEDHSIGRYKAHLVAKGFKQCMA